MAPMVEYRNPLALIPSNTSAVLALPCFLKHLYIISSNAFLFTVLSISKENLSTSLSTKPKS